MINEQRAQCSEIIQSACAQAKQPNGKSEFTSIQISMAKKLANVFGQYLSDSEAEKIIQKREMLLSMTTAGPQMGILRMMGTGRARLLEDLGWALAKKFSTK